MNIVCDSLVVNSTDVRLVNLETRFPFEFGIVEMTELPHCFVSVDLDVDGTTSRGLSADHFPPKWLTKDPSLSLESEANAMLEVVQQACTFATTISAETVFECWRQLYETQREWGEATEYPPLLWNFGVSFVERATIDAFCRATNTTFSEAISESDLGIRPGYVYPELAGTTPGDYLSSTPDRSVTVRHTVGHGDPLVDPGDSALDDGLPHTLEENVETYGLDRFKIKITGDVDGDYERLQTVLGLLDEICDSYSFTLDANEQYRSVHQLQRLVTRLRIDEALSEFDSRLGFIEQPFPRDIALTERVGSELRVWHDRPPIIIDESDGQLDSFGRALECGYDGTSYKNCKGVIKGLINACLAEKRSEDIQSAVILSGEDLTTIGPVSLQQDLAAMATVGVDDVERNGHHYFRGLGMFDESVQASVLSNHGDLYRSLEDGTPTVDIVDGQLSIESVLQAPFGYACEIDISRYADPGEWSFVSLDG